jgi:TorA maturation chaperone TorD
MDHNVETLIDRAIANTPAYLRAPGGDRRVARTNLGRILADLTARAPDHPALARLSAFIAELARQLNEEGRRRV